MPTYTDTTETHGNRVLTFRTHASGAVSAFIRGQNDPLRIFVGSHRPDGHVWAAHGDLRDSTEFPGMDVESWKNLVRLVHLYV